MEPRPVVQLTGRDSNAYAIMGACQSALKKAGASKAYIDNYLKDSKSGDYDNLLRVACEYCEVL